MFSALQTQGPGSPRSSPSHTISRPIPTPIHSDSAVTTPTHTPQDSLMGVGGDVQEAFAQGITAAAWHPGYCVQNIPGGWPPFFFFLHEQCLFFQGPRRNLRNDLLIAADSITSTMSSLVKELNSGNDAWLKSLCFCLSELVVKGYFSSEGGSETESTVDSDFGRGDLLAAASSDSFFSYKPRYSTVLTNFKALYHEKFTLSLFIFYIYCLL